MGYPLPPGDAYTDEMACMILFYPDKAAYRQALFGSLDYLGTWLAWQRDDDKRGIDAGRAWSEAVAVTRECVEMNTCEAILSLLAEIRDNTGVYCCDPVDVSDGDQYTDGVEDGVGDVPQNIIDAGYADDAADWSGFDDYKCIISHLMITNMYEQTLKFSEYTDIVGAVAGGLAAVAAIAAVILSGGGAVLVYGVVLGVVGPAVLYAAIGELGNAGLVAVASDLDDDHDELACAIYHADGSEGAVVALKDKIDELYSLPQAAYLKSLNLPAQLKALYAGRYDQQDVAQILADEGYDPVDFDCSCVIPTTPTILPIMAISWVWDMTGAALSNGVGSGDPHHVLTIAGGADYLFKDTNTYGPPNGAASQRWTFHHVDADEGYDDESPSHLISVSDARWDENDKRIGLHANCSSAPSQFILHSLRVFADNGAGYEWFDGHFTFISKNSGTWTYDSVAQTMTNYFPSTAVSKQIVFDLRAEVPD